MKKIKVTAQQRANAIEARDVMWPSVPLENVFSGLALWRSNDRATDPPTCGTVACFGGWSEWWPPFKTQIENSGASVGYEWNGVVRLFGDTSIVCTRGLHPADQGFEGGDHAVVLNRLNWLIENSEVAP